MSSAAVGYQQSANAYVHAGFTSRALIRLGTASSRPVPGSPSLRGPRLPSSGNTWNAERTPGPSPTAACTRCCRLAHYPFAYLMSAL